ncbi:phosphatase PAP2 family protein [Providencia sneebia]|uniref:PAP2 family protein n=1 Tax=Providencia sneebia DSM 19967 TaxID=1141660 RepID=K8WJA7_9GAMM|nr:phosphatase PAP2 family protein [Providencia sneebia]EKT60041.1 PAP2 family protein [Providencia sneebia DSM 19967]
MLTSRFNGLFTAELLLIWGLGTVGVFQAGLMATLLPAVIAGGIFWVIMLAVGLSKKQQISRFYWFGLLQLIACWSIFPLFKAIRIHYYTWSADQVLFQSDSLIWFGKSLPEWAINIQAPWLSEVVAFCYFSFYFLIIISALFFFLQRNKLLAQRYFFGLMLMYFWGFIGYFSLPAAGPYAAFPEVFAYPVDHGAMISLLTEAVDKGITGMDVFPSLHTGITLYIVGFVFLTGYRRTAYCLMPLAAGLILATVYLHYHYGIDVVIGAVLAFFVLYFTFKKEKVTNGTDLSS